MMVDLYVLVFHFFEFFGSHFSGFLKTDNSCQISTIMRLNLFAANVHALIIWLLAIISILLDCLN